MLLSDLFLVGYWGLVDGGNLCQLASSALIVWAASLLCRRKEEFFRLVLSFAAAYALAMFFFHNGLLSGFIGMLAYNVMVIVFYMTVGAIFLVFGGQLFYSWLAWHRGRSGCVVWGRFQAPQYVYRPLGIALAVLAAVNATFWPISRGATLWLEVGPLPGMLLRGVVFTMLYELMRLWPLWICTAVFVLVERSPGIGQIFRARQQIGFMLFSAVYLSLGGCLVFFFYPQGVLLQ